VIILALLGTKLLPLSPTAGRAFDNNSVPWTILFTLTLLTLLPAIVLSMTPMVRLLVVFHFLRQALGTQTAPSNQVLMGLGLMMTWFLMQPVLAEVEKQAVQPFQQGQISGWEAIRRGCDPPRKGPCALCLGGTGA
jgi:flagellar biosynthesis protein FliP